jgi:membrane-associated phospholipid phosphatase
MRNALRFIWKSVCAIAGAGMGAALLGFWIHSWTLAVIGALIGLPLGWLFGRFISPFDLLAELD